MSRQNLHTSHKNAIKERSVQHIHVHTGRIFWLVDLQNYTATYSGQVDCYWLLSHIDDFVTWRTWQGVIEKQTREKIIKEITIRSQFTACTPAYAFKRGQREYHVSRLLDMRHSGMSFKLSTLIPIFQLHFCKAILLQRKQKLQSHSWKRSFQMEEQTKFTIARLW